MEALFLFCCEPCLRGDDDSREFYDFLGVSQSASSDEIRSAYRRKALALHPDKLKQKGVTITAEHNEEFNRLKDAYDVLSDPKRRRIYDKVGETGLNILEAKAGSDPTMFLKNLKKNRRAMFRIALIITALFGLVVLQPILFILKVDEAVSGSWFAIWIPMLLVDGILMMNTLAILAVNEEPPEGEDPENWKNPFPLSTRLWLAWTSSIFVLLQIFILLTLDGIVGWSWAVAFIPWMIYEANILLESVPVAVREVEEVEKPEVDNETGDAEEAHMSYLAEQMESTQKIVERYDAQLSVLASLLRVVFLILLAVKLDSEPSNMTWGVVFIPIWLYFGFRMIFACVMCRASSPDIPEDMDEENIDPEIAIMLERSKTIQSKGSSSICMMIVPLVTAIVLVVHLEDPSAYGVAMIFIPFFIVVGLAYLMTLCAFYAVVNFADEPDVTGGYSPPQEPERDTDDSTAHINPITKDEPAVIPPSEPVVHVAPAAEQQFEQQQQVEETHIDLDVD